MAKFSNNNLSVLKLSISQLTENTGNVRKEYDWEEIKNLARSIQEHGLLNPITVKPGALDDETGQLKYEIICGHRRIRAIHELQKQGIDVGLVECCIRTGDTWTLQMIENIQRTDLTAQDKENAIREMLSTGLSQKEIADMLAKPISYVSDIVAGTKVREQAEAAGVDTSSLKTRALAQLRSVNAEDLPDKVQELSEAGGTNAVATKILHEYKEEKSARIEEPVFEKNMIEPEIPETTHVSSELEENKYTVYGAMYFDFRLHKLTLEGMYTLETAEKKAHALKKFFKNTAIAINWFVFDRQNLTVVYEAK